MTLATLALGSVVLNFGQVARVVAYHHDGIGIVSPVLKSFRASGKLYGGKWVADPAKCRLLTEAEIAAFGRGERIA